MKSISRVTPFPLRLREEVRGQVEAEASQNRRSLNSEAGLLIEEALNARKQKEQKMQA